MKIICNTPGKGRAYSVRVSWDKYLPDYPFFTVFNDIDAPNKHDAEKIAKQRFINQNPGIKETDPISTYTINALS